tara:strand:- start:420 stop:956 length:537 start_codon:yes stop_codon:yes gene_type:complete
MTDTLIKPNTKKLLSQMDFLEEDTKEHSEQFMIYYRQFLEEFPEKAPKPKPESFFEEEVDEETPPEEAKLIKKLYREISKISHPDKVESVYLESMFKETNTAYKNKDIAKLFRIAVTLEINLENIDITYISGKIKEKIRIFEDKILTYTNSYAWKWGTASTPEEEEHIRTLINSFVPI